LPAVQPGEDIDLALSGEKHLADRPLFSGRCYHVPFHLLSIALSTADLTPKNESSLMLDWEYERGESDA